MIDQEKQSLGHQAAPCGKGFASPLSGQSAIRASELPARLSAEALVIGGRYNWKNQPERLVYIGMCEPRNGRWHQFAKVGEELVWCEVLSADLGMLEATQS